jgi:plasmid maintenance system antidote protein VapI
MAQFRLQLCFLDNMPSDASVGSAKNVHAIRRANLLALLQSFCEQKLAAGVPAKGLELGFAEQLQVSKSLFSQLKSSRNISDAMAMQIEKRCGTAKGWLSSKHPTAASSRVLAGEERFLELARVAYRAQSAEGRKVLRSLLESAVTDKEDSS